ncbi:cobalt-precorrin 5A hydrolase [Lachnoclostridium phytofermentans]|uniref:Cobalamin (Vitamin B12) biosynthesis CbiG protein n=1 Tax=Lachnoclostridium phytofermentans (strain ATCC 700394 / DSM 18823 / ISDg) TaxID=357809 RepID=A9KP90_LACP7|nr:cobalt-precorrin 5A hydrolase [Lachnoclostridium phytofermentans]ABX41752.1 cobalamin (vitamin B12) biosynthesis CbiG protein [Lachnoclostridium phytofermentans ISDg]
MKVSLISFTLNGAKLGHNLLMLLKVQEYEARAFTIGAYAQETGLESINEPLKEWTKRQFDEAEGIIFIGATGIAVRAIAPFVKDKTKDPAVLVIDEKGEFVIPLLSGHIGGANELAYEIASLIRAIPVITTATDINQKFAVDLFTKKNNLYISRMDYAKEISAAVLNNRKIGFESDFPVIGTLPNDLTDNNDLTNNEDCEYGICISLNEKKEPYERTLNLIPKIITLGIGCRKGKASDEIEKVVSEVLKMNHVSIHSVANVSSIDLKKEEAGLLEFCDKFDLKLITYPAEVLEKVQGNYNESDFVKSVTGIGNVCERAAILGSCSGTLLQKKFAENGVTVSIARKDWSVRF